MAKNLKHPINDNEFQLYDNNDSQRILKIEVPVNLPNSGVPQTRKFVLRENIPDFTNLGGTMTSSFTAGWGLSYKIDATAGNIIVTIPAAATANGDYFIQLHRVDTSVNIVTVFCEISQYFYELLGSTNGNAFTMKTGGTVNIRSIGTVPVVTNYQGIATVSRLWVPTDAVAGSPVVWHDILDTTTLTLSGTAIVTLNNKGSLGAGFNITQGTAGSRPTLVGTSGVKGAYASFDGGH